MEDDVYCGYCYGQISSDDFLECEECEQYVHVKCLQRPGTPGDLVGDVFFRFTCSSCTADGKETFEREKLPWTLLISLAIYNLSKKSQGLSHHGYFHWRTHIAHFIEKNWSVLVDPTIKRRKNWTGTISGALSHNSPAIFTSGLGLVQEAGWWKLTHNKTPKEIHEIMQRMRREKIPIEEVSSVQTDIVDAEQSANEERMSEDGEVDEEPEVFSRTMPYMGRYPNHLVKKEPEIDIVDLLEPPDTAALLEEMPILSAQDVNSVIPSYTSLINANDAWTEKLLELDYDMNLPNDLFAEENDLNSFEPRIVQVTNYQEDNIVQSIDYPLSMKVETPSDDEDELQEDEPYEIKYLCEKSLFKASVGVAKQPWEIEMAKELDEENTDDFTGEQNIELMNEYEENEMYRRLKVIIASSSSSQSQTPFEIPAWVRRYYRKLCVRKMQRSVNKTVFNLDDFQRLGKTRPKTESIVLDRFHQLISGSGNFATGQRENSATFHARLAGSSTHELFISPHTGRILHPFIYRNDTCVPLWVKLMCELQYEVNGVVPSRASIDYCYVRPQHIAAVNALLQRMFWPCIDMSECLTYPDFSIVALYKKLVVGCAFLVPDVGHNEAYVSFMAVRPGWQRAGIASFMLYHLTQTCMGRDFTLHVSASNPAICLYQKFGFKIEEMILDFYEKFLPIDSTDSKHAFFLRLER